MSEAVWQATDSPTVLLNLLEQRGQQRRLRLIACLFFRRLLNASLPHLARARPADPVPGGQAILRLAERLADDPEDATTLATLCKIRTELSIEGQALARLMMTRTTTPPADLLAGQPPILMLPRLLLVASLSQFFLPPSALALAPLDPQLFGAILPLEVAELPPDHPRVEAERRVSQAVAGITNPIEAVQTMLEGLVGIQVDLLLAADGSIGPEPNLQSILGDLRVQPGEEMSPMLQFARDSGQVGIHDLLQYWLREVADPNVPAPTGSAGLIQALGLAFASAGLATLESDHPSLTTFREAERGLVRTIRALAGNPYRQPRIDPTWIQRDDQRVGKLAEILYQEQRWDDLPILGDALEEAGCADRGLLDALHEPAVPARGWWLLDALRIPT
jgi:hypothetical protein